MTEGQGESSIAPLFQSGAIKTEEGKGQIKSTHYPPPRFRREKNLGQRSVGEEGKRVYCSEGNLLHPPIILLQMRTSALLVEKKTCKYM